MERDLSFDVIIIGAGAAGCAVAAGLGLGTDLRIALLEAGPDYGPYDPVRWPAELLDARADATSHEWYPQTPLCCSRARVVGGCSAHNGCWALVGAPTDYDAWSPVTSGTWSYAVLRRYLRQALEQLRVRPVPMEDRSPLHAALIDAAVGVGLPYLDDVNDPSATHGVGWVPLNAVGPTRWHAAFAYLDPVRSRRNFTVLGDSHVSRVIMAGHRATGVEIVRDGLTRLIHAGTVVVCAGAYGTPPLLVRSGIGASDQMRDIGVEPFLDLPGVGANLTDHVGLRVEMKPRDEVATAVAPSGEVYIAQTVAKVRTDHAADGYWDMHVVPAAGPSRSESGRYTSTPIFSLYAAVMAPRSRGSVTTLSADPTVAPRIDHGFFTDPGGEDRIVAADGLTFLRELAGSPSLAGLILGDPGSWEAPTDETARRDGLGYLHPTGTCAMGPDSDPMAVTDECGRVHGTDNLYIADASVIPVIPRANTHVTTVAVGARLADLIADRLAAQPI
jgi:choline dehydrogenase